MSLNFRSQAIAAVLLLLLPSRGLSEPRGRLTLPANTGSILDHIYSGRRDLALPEIHKLEEQAPDDPLGYLLEAEAEWWRIWCDSAEFKYGMTMARHHEKAASDQQYLELTAKAYTLAQAKLRQNNSGEMHLYEAMADALSARLLAIRGEYRAAAHAGVRARANFQAALELDPTLYDAYTGLGLYNYYVDTLSTVAKALRFLMGIPGGTKAEGIRQLERGMQEGQISASLARFYLAMNLLNYDQKYEEALGVIGPLAAKYPGNPLFQLMEGDLNVKLGRKQVAENYYRAADAAANEIPEAECRAKMKQLAQQSQASMQVK
jgi:predicted negative regulator of RcsB-dependent stress response